MNPRGLFVTGTDTSVGKTRVAASILRALIADGRRVGAVKPIATSGFTEADGTLSTPDARELLAALGKDVPLARIAPIVLPGELAPSVAMRRSGRKFALGEIVAAARAAIADWAEEGAEVVVVEGVGGLLCPIADGATVADLAAALDYPLVIVSRRGLGTLNHTLLTVEAARSRGLKAAGIVLNGSEPTANEAAEATNPAELARFLDAIPILADAPFAPQASASGDPIHDVDWWERAGASVAFDAQARPPAT